MIVIMDADEVQGIVDLAVSKILTNQEKQGELIVATAKEVIDSVVLQLKRAVDEIVAKIESGTVTQEDLAPLQAVSDTLDNLAPELPEGEVPVEPIPEPEANPGQL